MSTWTTVGTNERRATLMRRAQLLAGASVAYNTIEAVIDRFKPRADIKQRLAESFETALRLGEGLTAVAAVEALALTPERIDLTGQAVVIETLKKRRSGVAPFDTGQVVVELQLPPVSLSARAQSRSTSTPRRSAVAWISSRRAASSRR